MFAKTKMNLMPSSNHSLVKFSDIMFVIRLKNNNKSMNQEKSIFFNPCPKFSILETTVNAARTIARKQDVCVCTYNMCIYRGYIT